jgi:hypothetical protein
MGFSVVLALDRQIQRLEMVADLTIRSERM